MADFDTNLNNEIDDIPIRVSFALLCIFAAAYGTSADKILAANRSVSNNPLSG